LSPLFRAQAKVSHFVTRYKLYLVPHDDLDPTPHRELSRNFRFAFRLLTNVLPSASAYDLFGIGSKAKDPVVHDTAFAGTKKALICAIPQRFLGHFSLNLLRRPDWFRLAAAPIRLAPANPH
jgi:hypothetical protein